MLPYKLTKGGDGGWTTVDGGWELYGRTSVDVSPFTYSQFLTNSTLQQPTHQALADTDQAPNTTFNITASLPSGWGLDSQRGALYAVPLIVVASVCMALLFMAFVVLVVISRVKARRKAERSKRRREAREKRERREKRAAARAAAVPDAEDGEERSASVRTRESRRRGEEERDRFDSVSTLSDSSDGHDDDADSSRRPSGSGTTSTTVRLAKQRAVAVAAAEAIEAAPRAGRAKKRFGWTSGVNVAAVGVGTARLGDPRRVWGWKKGLRRRNVGAVEEREQEREVDRMETREPTDVVTGSPVVETLPERSPVSTTSNIEDPHVLGDSSDDPSSADAPTEETPRAPASAFPPAYYRTTSGNAVPSTSATPPDESTTGRVTDVGPSARALEKRPMAGVGYDDCFPAPTTEEQEEAVNIAYNRNLSATGETAAETAGEYSGAMAPMPTGAAGHVATDDKQVLERLRLAGSAPPPLDEPAGASGDPAIRVDTVEPAGTAPDLPVDEDGFETLEELAPPDEDAIPGASNSVGLALPLPPAPVAQRSLAYTQPSASPGMSSPIIASAPSAPYEEPEGPTAMPSAPPLDLDSAEPEDRPEPGAPPLSPDNVPDDAADPTGSLSRRFTVPHRTLGIDLPSDLAAPPAFPHSEDPVATSGVASSGTAVGASRYLPRYEP